MSYSVEIPEQADADLRGIFEYIAFELQSIQNAVGQLARLEKNILSLDRMPERFRRYGKEPWHSRGLHRWIIIACFIFLIPRKASSVLSASCTGGGI